MASIPDHEERSIRNSSPVSAGGGRRRTKRTLGDVVRHFTPAWFAVTMGTGSISILFSSFPYGSSSQLMRILSLGSFFLNLTLFMLFTTLSVARYIFFPGIWSRMLRHPVQSLYLGTFPMGGCTLFTVSVTLIYGTYHFGGRPFVYIVWALWWLDVAISVLCLWGMVHIMITRHEHSFESMTLSWLLPIVPFVVGASTGACIAQVLIAYSPNAALITITFSACMVIIGLALSMMLLTTYLIRTIMYGYSKGPAILSIFFPLGPSGQGAYAILVIGSGFKSLTQQELDGLLSITSTGEIINVVCVVTAFLLWSFGALWLISAFFGLWHSLRRAQVPFRLTFWSMIFPNGVYAHCTLALASAFSSSFFRVWGSIHAVATILLWVYVAVQTLRMCLSGAVFDALPMEEDIGRREEASRSSDEERGRSDRSAKHPMT